MDFAELRLDAVSRHFSSPGGDQIALNQLSLRVARGEFIALLGPSGCGKSTALNCVAGLLTLSSGSIHLDSQRIDLLPTERRGFGMVFQNYALFPHMSVRKNVAFGLKMRGVPETDIQRRVQAALSLVQLQGHEDKLPGQLSGGQQQRVAIARAVVVEPPLVLMDEPLSNLDAKLRLEMRAEIRRIHRQLGRTTLYVTHDQDEALSLADRIVVMSHGVAQQVAPPKVVYLAPANLLVARFMGYRNVLPVQVEGLEGTRARLRAPGAPLSGTVVQAFGGRKAFAAMRPDDMVLVAAGAPQALPGTVSSVEYCGRDSLIEVSTEGGDLLFARTVDNVQPGDRVHVAAAPERVLVYPADETVN
jgi:putative spermidine/putrescine transport system ATP-binding protein